MVASGWRRHQGFLLAASSEGPVGVGEGECLCILQPEPLACLCSGQGAPSGALPTASQLPRVHPPSTCGSSRRREVACRLNRGDLWLELRDGRAAPDAHQALLQRQSRRFPGMRWEAGAVAERQAWWVGVQCPPPGGQSLCPCCLTLGAGLLTVGSTVHLTLL